MRKKIFLFLLSNILLLSVLIYRFSSFYSISCKIYAENGIKSDISKQINDLIISVIDNEYENSNRIIEIEYASDKSISSIAVNTINITKIANRLSSNIYNCINNTEYKYGIPFGNTLGYEYFSGIGPKIPVKIIPIGTVTYKIESELIESAINQTLHRITINYNINIECLAPFNKNAIEIDTSIILAETLIVGKVPQISFFDK